MALIWNLRKLTVSCHGYIMSDNHDEWFELPHCNLESKIDI